MAPRIDDRWLWLGLGIFTLIAIKCVSHGLDHIISLTTVHHKPPSPTPNPNRGPESSIKTSSLEILATCSNIEIRKAATKILCERFFADSHARKTLLKNLESKNENVRHRAQLAFNLLSDYGVIQEVVFPPTPRATRARARSRRLAARVREVGDELGELEVDLRRMRREAMVINEGDRPLSQEDVWMRGGAGRMSEEEARSVEGDLERISRREGDDTFA
ncbi:hypothetical protein K469DRAFT_704721 [Zopfia rhizophila CBS 207.26]|uniref:Uncharacterized protein n=1 Tax=Zopfia rhizophila CBS 207.26 TaxID=1314779 RepID=A0A6A6ECB1_9PEZI|nr:hypothetical protein K469DRAFT_704721 [Zopfia rhizophila CBS 207.26]